MMVVSLRWRGVNEGPVTALPFSKPVVPLSTSFAEMRTIRIH